MFPPEIFERILFHCDGKTLKNARYVNSCWRQIVDYLTRETDIWKRCCFNDIPKNEFLQYLDKWVAKENEEKWFHLYENWLAWYDIEKNIDFEVTLMGDHRRIACVNASGNYIALGFESGTVKVFDQDFHYVRIYRHLNVPVHSVSMVCENDSTEPTDVIIYYGDKVFIHDFDESYQPALFTNCFKFSSYNKFICGVTKCGKITIAKILTDTLTRSKSFAMITFVRIYSPETVTVCKLWKEVCIIIMDDKVKTISYYDGLQGSLKSHIMASEKTILQYTNMDFDLQRDVQIFNNNIIISLTKGTDSLNEQVFELFILGTCKTNSKKMFVPWKTFTAQISSMFLYGNTFILGLNTGLVYFYEIHDWKLFDLSNFVHVENIGKLAPIISIDGIECQGRRTFFVTTSMKVHQIAGYSVPDVETMVFPALW